MTHLLFHAREFLFDLENVEVFASRLIATAGVLSKKTAHNPNSWIGSLLRPISKNGDDREYEKAKL
jgi:hypothetical protein